MLIVNPNVCIDRTIDLDDLRPGDVQRTGAARVTLGGKGINVARVGRRLAHRSTILGFLPSEDAARLGALAAGEGAELVGVDVTGAARVATILLEASGRVTVLNEPGATVTGADWDRLLDKVRLAAGGHESVACSGSLPPGSPADAYGKVVAVAHGAALRAVVDATGDALLQAIAAGADVVSPNLSEAEAVLFGRSVEVVEPSGPDVVERAAHAVVGLVERGARHAIVSAGSHGAAFDLDGHVAWCPAPKVEVVNPIGAGDSLVGGLVHALEIGSTFSDAVRYGIVTASASCEDPLAGGVDVERIASLLAGLAPVEILPGCELAGGGT